MKISNTMHIKNADGSFEDVKISYIKPKGRTEEGIDTVAVGEASHVEGKSVISFGECSHAEGESSTRPSEEINSESTFDEVSQEFFREEGTFGGAYGNASHSEGKDTIAIQDYSHAEGHSTIAYGKTSHAEGKDTSAIGHAAHAEGDIVIAQGDQSHAEGLKTIAAGNYSHVEGYGTIAPENCHGLHVQGKYNKIDEENMEEYAHIVGNGEDEDSRSNAYTLDWDGNAWFAGSITVGGTKKRIPTLETCKAQLEFNQYGQSASMSNGDNGIFHISLDGKTLTIYFHNLDFSSYNEVYIAQVKVYWYDAEKETRRLYPNCSFYVDLLSEGDLIVDLPTTPPLNTPIFISVAKLK